MAEDKGKLGMFILAFVTVIVGIALISSLADSVWINTNTFSKSGANNNTVDISSVRVLGSNNFTTTSVSLGDTYIRSLTQVRWENGTILTRDTDFTLDETAGTFVMLNSTTNRNHNETVTNLTEWDYTYGESYITDTSSRTLLNLIVIFFVIGLVIGLVALIMKRWQEM